jgi:hypothetical protein
MSDKFASVLGFLFALGLIGLFVFGINKFTEHVNNPPKGSLVYSKAVKLAKKTEYGSDTYYVLTLKGLFQIPFEQYMILNVNDCISIDGYLKFIPIIDTCS